MTIKKIDQLIQAEKNTREVYELLTSGDAFMAAEIAFAKGWTKAKTAHYIKKLLKGGHIFRECKGLYSGVLSKPYVEADYERVDKDDKLPIATKKRDYDAEEQRREKHKVVQGNVTTYYNLSRQGSDYAWQRKKKKTVVSIGSGLSGVV